MLREHPTAELFPAPWDGFDRTGVPLVSEYKGWLTVQESAATDSEAVSRV